MSHTGSSLPSTTTALGVCSVCKLFYLVLSLLGCYLSSGTSTQVTGTTHHAQEYIYQGTQRHSCETQASPLHALTYLCCFGLVTPKQVWGQLPNLKLRRGTNTLACILEKVRNAGAHRYIPAASLCRGDSWCARSQQTVGVHTEICGNTGKLRT